MYVNRIVLRRHILRLVSLSFSLVLMRVYRQILFVLQFLVFRQLYVSLVLVLKRITLIAFLTLILNLQRYVILSMTLALLSGE